MELLNPPISKPPQLFSCFSSYTSRYSFKTSNKKPLRRFQTILAFPRSLPLSGTKVFQVSARFVRPTSRRNSLRKKLLINQEKVRQNPIPLNPAPDFQNPIDGFQNLNSDTTKRSGVDSDISESKSKDLGESVLLTKLENWVDQYKKDTEFWGIGSGPIFTVLQDLQGIVKRVEIHEDEILRRLEFEEMEKVNFKVLYAKNLAGEMERDKNMIPKNSSVVKFDVSEEESGLVSEIRGVNIPLGFMPKLLKVGSLVLGGLFVFWAVKKLFVLGNKVEHKEMEKDMRKMKSRKEKEKEMMGKGSVEVVKASIEQPSVSFQKPKLDKEELMKNILKAKVAKGGLVLIDFSGSSKSVDCENETQETEVIAKKAQETEGREQSLVGKDEKEGCAADKEFLDGMQPSKEEGQGNLSFMSDLSNAQSNLGDRTMKSTASCEPKGDGAKFLNGVAALDSRVGKITNTSNEQLSKEKQSSKEDLKTMESTSPSLVNKEVSHSPVLPNKKAYAKRASFKKKPKVILSVKEAREFLSTKSNKEDLNHESVMKAVQKSASDIMLPNGNGSAKSTKQMVDVNSNNLPCGVSGGELESAPSKQACQSAIREDKEPVVDKGKDEEDSDKKCTEEVHQQPLVSSDESDSMSGEQEQSKKAVKWIENNFHEVEPVLKKIGDGFRENYMLARDRAGEQANMHTEITKLGFNEDESELEWMKDDRLRDIVFQVRENELAGQDPFYSMDDEKKLAFFQGLEKKVERENEKLSHLHEWLHSNIENLDYGTDGISVHDPPEKIIPRWKGPPLQKNPEHLRNFQEQRKALFTGKAGITYPAKTDGQSVLQKFAESVISSSEPDLKFKSHDADPKDSKVVVEGSDGSLKPGKKSGKEYWQHTKKWSRGFLESYNAENDPEIKSIMKDIGKDLDRWITEKEIKEAADLMTKLPERNKKFMEKKLNKIRREMELFGPQAVVSKYREYAEEKEEDYLWWLDLPHVLCIELYTFENEEQRIGFYALEMAADLELEPKPHHVIAFEDTGDCKNFCYIIQAHMEMLGTGRAFIVPQPPKNAFREAKASGFGVTVVRKGELELNVDQTLEEVEEQICEIGSKMYHDMIMRERSVDISSLMKGALGVDDKPTRRRRSKKKLKRPTKNKK